MTEIKACDHAEYKFDPIKSADEIVYDYIAHDGEIGIRDCGYAALTYEQCDVVTDVLTDGYVAPHEKENLKDAGLPEKFISTLSGPDGTRAMRGRAKFFQVQEMKEDVEVSGLIEMLSDGEVAIREEAALSLGELGIDAKSAIPALIDALGDSDTMVRVAAVRALGGMGDEGIKAIPALIEVMKNDEVYLREQAAFALSNIATEPKEINVVIKAYTELLKDDTALLRRIAAQMIGGYGASAKKAVPDLIEALKDENSSVRKAVAYALGEIGPDASDAVPALLDLYLNDELEKVRKAAFWAINKINADALYFSMV
jgi:HEAT repeat protein